MNLRRKISRCVARCGFILLLVAPLCADSTAENTPTPTVHINVRTLDRSAGFSTEHWTTSARLASCRAFHAFDLNVDGYADIVAQGADGLMIGMNIPGQKRFEFRPILNGLNRGDVDLSAGIFDCAGEAEIILLDKSTNTLHRIPASTGQLEPLPFVDDAPQDVLAVRVGDTDGDGLAELVTFDRSRHYRIYKRTETGAFKFISALYSDLDSPQFHLADVFGDGISRIAHLHRHDGRNVVHFQTNDESTLLPRWAQFDPMMRPALWSTGDFNGDGRGDAIVFGDSVYRWWLAQSVGDTSIEEPIHGIAVPKRDRDAIAAADFDADGQDDLVFCNTHSRSLSLAMSRIGRLLSGAQIRWSGSTVTEEEAGRFVAHGPVEGAPDIKVAGYRVAITDLGRAAKSTCRSKTIHAIAVSEERDRTFIGQALRIGPDAAGPFVCTGFNPIGIEKWTASGGRCPENYAYFGADDVGGKRPLKTTRLSAKCCRLPSDDLLLPQTFEASLACPDDAVAVGSVISPQDAARELRLLCRKINTKRYRLGPPTPGVYFGAGLSMRWYGPPLLESEIPLAIRLGIIRHDYSKQQIDGCAGIPFGSVLTNKGKRCGDFAFRQFQYRGELGDPPSGTPVTMFPDCAELEDPLSPTSGCRPARSSKPAE